MQPVITQTYNFTIMKIINESQLLKKILNERKFCVTMISNQLYYVHKINDKTYSVSSHDTQSLLSLLARYAETSTRALHIVSEKVDDIYFKCFFSVLYL